MRFNEDQAEMKMADKRYVEDDLQKLYAVDQQIRELVQARASLVSDIKKQNANNMEAVMGSDDWFEGSLKGNPVAAREADPGPYDEPSIARRR